MKGAIDPVTETDYQCQEMIIGMIRQAFPDHGFLAEETAGEGGPAARESPGLAWEAIRGPPAAGSSTPWTAPSILPTGFRLFCVSIACEADGHARIRGDLRPPAG